MWKIVQIASTLITAFFTIVPGMMVLAPEFGWPSNAPIRWLIDNSFWITTVSAMLFGGLIGWQLKVWVLKRNGVTVEHIAQLEKERADLKNEKADLEQQLSELQDDVKRRQAREAEDSKRIAQIERRRASLETRLLEAEAELRTYVEPPITEESILRLSDSAKAALCCAYKSGEPFKFDERMMELGVGDLSVEPPELDSAVVFGLNPTAAPVLARAGLVDEVSVDGQTMWLVTARASAFLDDHENVVDDLKDASVSWMNEAFQLMSNAELAAKDIRDAETLADFAMVDFKWKVLVSCLMECRTIFFDSPAFNYSMLALMPDLIDQMTWAETVKDGWRMSLDPYARQLFDDSPEALSGADWTKHIGDETWEANGNVMVFCGGLCWTANARGTAAEAAHKRDDLVRNPDKHLQRLPIGQLEALQLIVDNGYQVADAEGLPTGFWDLEERGIVRPVGQDANGAVFGIAHDWEEYLSAFPDALATEIARAEAGRARHEEC